MAGTFALQLAELLDVIQGDREVPHRFVGRINRFHPAEVEHGIEQHGGMADRQYEPIAVGPDRIVRIEPQEVLPQGVHHRRHGHRRAGMAGVCLLDRIH